MNETLDPSLRSWVASANDPASDFPIQNLPFGVFRPKGRTAPWHIGVAIGDQILDLAACHEETLLAGSAAQAGVACLSPTLNELMSLGRRDWQALRERVSALLAEGTTESLARERVARLLVDERDVEMGVPAAIGDYTDFYASIHHATNVGRLFRPDQPLLPNYRWVPIGYHGRASSIVASGTPIVRPSGQTRPQGDEAPPFGPSRRLDYELEVGCYIGPGNALAAPVAMADAEAHVFGLCLVNDWSARDIQQWEYQPLGPFLAKSFATTVAPWVVMLDALEPFRTPFTRPAGEPAPLPHLDSASNRERGAFDITLDVALRTAGMRARGEQPVTLTRTGFASMYWTFAQMVAHHASNGCNLRPGDLLASGTVSGPADNSRGCLLELTSGGTVPITLPDGERRTFLADGDEVVVRGFCERPGWRRVGFGECRGIVAPAI